MSYVQISGVLMGTSIKSSTYEGNTKHTLKLDVYQPSSNSNNKMVTLTTDKIEWKEAIDKDYSSGSVITCLAYVNAYKNNAYYKLDQIVQA